MNLLDAGVIRSFRRAVHNATKRRDDAMMTPLPVLRYLIGMIDSLTEGPLTPEQAQEAFDAQANTPPLPEERINAIVSRVVTINELTTANQRLRNENTNILNTLEIAIRWLRRLEEDYPGCLNDDAIAKHLEPALNKAKGTDL